MVVWYTDQPRYYTDPGDLSAWVDHAAADAMVAAAASVWNVPTARIVLAQGGILDEPVSSANVYPDTGGLVFPADVASANYIAKQIAVIYDRDGSVTDLLLGGGASDPSGCRQNAVTESVDSIGPGGFIKHAIVILNGRCTGPAPEQQLQMQYELERVFGRVLGLGWSQLNDNVFTGTPQPTYLQALHWPIMHPIDVVCGMYTYQCLPQPFTLRDDDVASITQLYPVTGTPAAGKILSLTQASVAEALLSFPTGQGMAGVNVVLRREWIPQFYWDSFEDVSTVTGVLMQQQSGNPISPKPTGMTGSLGTPYGVGWSNVGASSLVHFPWVPLPAGQTAQTISMHTAPINPLYVGEYAVGPYGSSTVAPSGSTVMWGWEFVHAGQFGSYENFVQTATGAASNCATGGDGKESAPTPVVSGGWWTGVLCGTNPANQWSFMHSAWTELTVQANRSLTVEVTSLDEQEQATENKARPVIGIWNATDAVGSAPSVMAAAAFNSATMGLTTLSAQTSSAETLRLAIAEERGDGRPDYAYQARILYADTMAPLVAGGGAQITITGMGFRPGNAVTIAGVAAKVLSWTATTIVATVPYLKSVLPGTTLVADVTVTDVSTGGGTTMMGAFTYVYTVLPYTLALVSGPSGSLPVSLPVAIPFAVKVIDVDGVTPLSGVPVVFTTMSGSALWSTCGAATTCSVTTDGDGTASLGVTPAVLGAVSLQAAALGQARTVSFQAVELVRLVTVIPATTYLAAGATATWGVAASLLQQGLPGLLTPISWAVSGIGISLSGLQTVTDLLGEAQATVTAGPLASGVQVTGSACAWGLICGSFVSQGVDPSQFVVTVSDGAGQSIAANQTLLPMTFTVTDGSNNPVVGASVTIHQALSQWTADCPAQGRCPDAPVYQTSVTTVISGKDGTVTVAPLQMAGPEVTDVVATSGVNGFVSLNLQKHP
jgi:hypothetical protein